MSAALTDFAPNHYGDAGTKRRLRLAMYVALAPFGLALLGYRGAIGGDAAGGWLAFGLVFAPFLALALAYIRATYRGSTPGIKNDGVQVHELSGRRVGAYLLGTAITSLYVILYWFPGALTGVVQVMEPLSQALRKGPADQWFFYGFLYTAAVIVMGIRMIYRYRHNKYQIFRTLSVMFFQLAFAFVLPALLRAFNQPEFYFTYFWPLKYDYLFPGSFEYLWKQSGGVGMFMFGWGVIASFVLTPLLTWRFGKRWYCSWVCG
ncbi:MAG: hypothetical protein KC549_17220, partial [Myxococcales bacterium]|nr:hypothetical protein [Myxococcales bacterium]